jgi:hypothetical protein
MNPYDEGIINYNDDPIKINDDEPFKNEYEGMPIINVIDELLMFPELIENKYFNKCLHDIINKQKIIHISYFVFFLFYLQLY